MSDLHQELWNAIQRLRPAHRARFELGAMDCGIARVRFERRGYVPDDDGIGAILFPVFDAPDPFSADLLDLVARQPTSGEIATRNGIACALGRLDATLAMDAPLRLYRSPRGWKGDPDGAVIVDWSAADLLVLNQRHLIAEDVDHGKEIEGRLKALRRRLTPPMPVISVEA